MTYFEKLLKEHPEDIINTISYTKLKCPHHYCYMKAAWTPDCASISCKDCWNQEIPDTEDTESLYPKCIINLADVDLDTLVTKCINAKKRLIVEGDCKPSEAVALVNSMLRMYGRTIVGLNKEEQK